MSDRYEKYGVLLNPSPQWAIDLFGFKEEHAGDCISWMMWKCCTDRSYVKYIPICSELLENRKRWPDGFQEEHSKRIAKTKIRYGWSKVLYKLGIIKQRLYRTQHGMTRDPYTYFMAAIILNGFNTHLWFMNLNIPWTLYSPTFWAWKSYLITGKEKYRNRYIRRELRGTPARQYVKDMAMVRAKAADCTWLYEQIRDTEVKPNKG